MPTIYIDDQAHEVPEGDNVLEACLNAGIDLPYFCWHPEMGSVGACRQCALVQYRDAQDTRGRIVMGCMTPVSDGARFSMKGSKASEFRSNVVESLMLNHPHDCPVCAEGGECHLQDMTVMVGHRNRSYRGKKNTHTNQDLGPLIHHEMNRCITCYRCTRFYNDYAGGKDLAALAAHDHVYFGRHEDGTLESEFAGNLVEVCPTGVFTDKPLVNDYTRKWDMQSAPSVCTGCAVGCNTLPGERYGKLKRIHNRFNSEVNGYFLCDRGRYGGSYVSNESRAKYAGLRQQDGRYNAIEAELAQAKLNEFFNGSNSSSNNINKSSNNTNNSRNVMGIGSPRASLESNYLLRELVGEQNYASGMADSEAALVGDILNIMQHSGVHSPSLKEIEQADAILILGEDVTNTAPRMALSLRQSVRNLAKQMAAEMRIPEWQDEAVRNLAQDKLSPLYIASVADTKLDDVAHTSVSLAPDDIARFGFAVANDVSGVTAEHEFDKELIHRIADDLKSAKRPLIVSGTGAQNSSIVHAAAAVASALNGPPSSAGSMLSYCVPESNSLGVAMLAQKSTTFADIFEQANGGKIDTLVVLENDLYRRAPQADVERLLSSVNKVVVLDVVNTPTLAKSSLALPSASFTEAEGTLVNNEGRAQRHYPVYLPAEQRQASWQWLNQALASKNNSDPHQTFDDVVHACASSNPVLSGITQASPASDFRSRGVKIPRQTHRYSGRTAMRADISVHEPKQPQDTDSPLAYTMEGDNNKPSGALLPFVWSPGWNSNQSLHKFQSEIGGPLEGGTAGTRLIEPVDQAANLTQPAMPDAYQSQNGSWLLVPLYRIFGSDELSVHATAIAELTSTPFIQLSPDDASQLNAQDGDMLGLGHSENSVELRLEINPRIPAGCAGYSVGLPNAPWLAPNSTVSLIIASKRTVDEKVSSGGANV